MASLGKDAEESALPCESGRMVRGGLCYVMQHRVVAVHCERRDCRSGGARNIPSRLIKNGGAGGDWAKADGFVRGCRGGAGGQGRMLGRGWRCWLGLRRPAWPFPVGAQRKGKVDNTIPRCSLQVENILLQVAGHYADVHGKV